MRLAFLAAAVFTLGLMVSLALFSLQPSHNTSSSTLKHNQAERVEVKVLVKPTLEVTLYRGGEPVYHFVKEGDPLTVNFIKIVYNTFLGQWYTERQAYIIATDGTQIPALLDTEYSNDIVGTFIAVGNGTGTPNPTDTQLFNQIDMQPVSFVRSYNATHYMAEVAAAFTFTESNNITEVGLVLAYKYSGQTKYILLAHDVLSQAIQVQPGDVLDVKYRFVYTKPVLYNLAEAISRYLLAWSTYNHGNTGGFTRGDGTSFQGIDFGIDYYSSPNVYDYVKESLWIQVGNAQSPSFTLSMYNILGSRVWWMQAVAYYYYNSTHVCTVIVGSFGVPEGVNATEIMVFTYSDAAVGNLNEPSYFGMLYMPLDNPLQGANTYSIRIDVCFG